VLLSIIALFSGVQFISCFRQGRNLAVDAKQTPALPYACTLVDIDLDGTSHPPIYAHWHTSNFAAGSAAKDSDGTIVPGQADTQGAQSRGKNGTSAKRVRAPYTLSCFNRIRN